MTDQITTEDRAAITDMLTRYNRCADDGRFDLIPPMFTEDATFAAMGQQVAGRDAIAAFFPVSDEPPAGPSTMHILANVVLDPLDSGDVAGVSDFLVLHRKTNGDYGITMAGRYTDVLRQEAGEWRFASRHSGALKRLPG